MAGWTVISGAPGSVTSFLFIRRNRSRTLEVTTLLCTKSVGVFRRRSPLFLAAFVRHSSDVHSSHS